MARKKATKKNTEKNTAEKTSKNTQKSTAKKSSGSTGRNSSKSSGRKRKYTPKVKPEPVELQQYWNLPDDAGEHAGSHIEVAEKPEEAPAAVYVPEKPEKPAAVQVPEKPAAVQVPEKPAASAESGTKVIDINDYQPVIWVNSEDTPSSSAVVDNNDDTSSGSAVADNNDNTSSSSTLADTIDSSMNAEPAAEERRNYDEAAEPAGAEQIAIDFKVDTADARRSRTAARTASAMFFGVLVLMLVMNIVTKDVLYSDQENRVFQQLPKFSVGNYLSGRFESQLDNYVSDQFAWRNAFIKIKSAADLTIGQIKANGVFKAKDSYLMEDITYPDESSVAADIKALKKFKKKYKGKKMYFMLVPNAANILADKLPAGVVTHDQNADMDKLFKAVKKMGYEPIDVRDDLAGASKKQQVYYRTDHHWTTDGAYVAYRKAAEIMKLKSETEYEAKVVKKDFVGTLYSKSGFTNGRKDAIKIYLPKGDKYLNSVIRYKDKKEKTTMYYDMANLDIKDAYTVFGGTNQSLITISTPTNEDKHLLVVKDSYANCFIPFLTQDYRTITIVDPRYYYENIATVMKADEIDEVLFLYNANTFFSDNYMRMMLTNR